LSKQLDDADEQSNVRKGLVILGIVVVLAAGIYFLFLRTPAAPSVESLTATALTAPNSADRLRAVAELGQMRPGVGFPQPQLIKVAKESKDGEVVASAIVLLRNLNETQPLLYVEAMEHEDAGVREKGWLAIGGLFPDLAKVGASYSPGGPPEIRKTAIRDIRAQIESAEKRTREMHEKRK